eukprot:14979662-Alexandrium_andersonii.AAC.1
MSASLVGSEMCIRDRNKSLTSGSAEKWDGGVKDRCKGASHGRDTPAPVSYTHLTLPTICSV